MNWIEIKQKFPKAFDVFKSKYPDGRNISAEKLAHSLDYAGGYNLRNLYDFFDENEIIIEIRYSVFIFEKRRNDFDFLIYIKDLKDCQSIGERVNFRKEAETAAFEKSFEILEKSITTEESKLK